MSWVTELEAEPGLEPKCPDPGLWPHSIHHPLHPEARLRVTILWPCLPHRWVGINTGWAAHHGHQDQPG